MDFAKNAAQLVHNVLSGSEEGELIDDYLTFILEGALETENMPLVEHYLKDASADILETALIGAIKAQSLGWIYFFLKKRVPITREEIEEAAKVGNVKILDYLLSKITPTKFTVLAASEGAILGKHKELIDRFLPQVEDNLRFSLIPAAITADNMQLIETLMKGGNMELREGLTQAIFEDNLKLVKFFFEKLKLDEEQLVYFLSLALDTESWRSAKFLIEKGAPLSELRDTDANILATWAKHGIVP